MDGKRMTAFSCMVIIIMVSLVAIVQVIHAQNSPQDYVDAHNRARAAVGVRNIEWSDEVAAYAEQYAYARSGDCVLQHSNGPYGENLAFKGDDSLNAAEAVQMWVDEAVDYDYGSNTCAPGKECKHYTQVIWRNSVRLGCAKVICMGGESFITCNYDPPGNYIGEKPY